MKNIPIVHDLELDFLDNKFYTKIQNISMPLHNYHNLESNFTNSLSQELDTISHLVLQQRIELYNELYGEFWAEIDIKH